MSLMATGEGAPIPPSPVLSVDLINFAVGDGVTNDTANVAAAIAAAGVGGRVYVPGGKTFAVTTMTPLAGQTIYGEGTILRLSGNSRLLSVNHVNGVTVEGLTLDGNGLAGDVLFIGGADNADTSVRRLTIKNGTGVSAAGIQVSAAVRARIDNVAISNCYWGILLNTACVDTELSNFTITATTSSAASEGALYLANAVRPKIVNGLITGCGQTGVYLAASCVNASLSNVHSVSNGTAGSDHRGFAFTGGSGHKLSNCHAELNIECGYYLSSTTTDVDFANCHAKANNVGNRAGGHGFEIDGLRVALAGCESYNQTGNAGGAGSGFALGGTDLSVTGCVSYNNYSHGFRSAGGSRIVLTGCIAKNNSQAGAGNADGFRFDVAAANIYMNGCVAYDSQGGKTQGYGVQITGSATNVFVTSCDLAGNLTAAVANAITTARITGCNGYNPLGHAVTQPAVPASTVAQTNTFGVDCMVVVNAGTVTVIAIGGSATGQVAGEFRVPAGQTITLTYTVAPTWQWFGD